MEASGWEECHSELGKTVFRPEDEDKRQNSIFIASKGLHNPHAMPSDHARFVVEAIGPDITGGSSEWEYYDNHKLALSQVAEFMKRYISDEEFEENLREIVPWMD